MMRRSAQTALVRQSGGAPMPNCGLRTDRATVRPSRDRRPWRRVDVVNVVDGEPLLRMSGGCPGCAASTATLRDGVERMVRAAVPEIVRIVDVTDHDAGLTPYYSTTVPAREPAGARGARGRHLARGRAPRCRQRLSRAPARARRWDTARRDARRPGSRREERGEGDDATAYGSPSATAIVRGARSFSQMAASSRLAVPSHQSTDPERDEALPQASGVSPGAAARLALGRLRRARRGARRLATAPRRPTGWRAGDYYGRGRGRGRPFLAALVVGRARAACRHGLSTIAPPPSGAGLSLVRPRRPSTTGNSPRRGRGSPVGRPAPAARGVAPMAPAKRRAWRGLTLANGRPAAARARSRPR